MLISLALIFLTGMCLGGLLKRLRLPGLLGLLFTGMALGPFALDLLDPSILGISADLREIALVIILTRAGLSLELEDLKKVGRPAVLLCFVPACFEMAGMALLAPRLLGVSLLDAAIMGTVVGAVSPAVIVPKMLSLMEEGYGVKQRIPQMILAGASVDDVFVIVMFSAFTGLAQGEGFSPVSLFQVPVSILTGAAAGAAVGAVLAAFVKRVHMRDSAKVVVLLSLSFLLVSVEDGLKGWLPFSGLLAVMSLGLGLQRRNRELAVRLSGKYSKLWVASEVLLFVLVGAMVDPSYALQAGGAAVLLIFGVLLFRVAGVFLCVLGTALNGRELFCFL